MFHFIRYFHMHKNMSPNIENLVPNSAGSNDVPLILVSLRFGVDYFYSYFSAS